MILEYGFAKLHFYCDFKSQMILPNENVTKIKNKVIKELEK